MKTRYRIEVKLPGAKTWIDIIDSYEFMTMACLDMIMFKAAYPENEYKIRPAY